MLVKIKSRKFGPRVGNLTIWQSLKAFLSLEKLNLLKSPSMIIPQLAKLASIVVSVSYK